MTEIVQPCAPFSELPLLIKVPSFLHKLQFYIENKLKIENNFRSQSKLFRKKMKKNIIILSKLTAGEIRESYFFKSAKYSPKIVQEFSAAAEPRGRRQEQCPRRAPGQDEGRAEEREQG